MVDHRKIQSAVLIPFLYGGASAWFFIAWDKFYKSNQYVNHQCQVNSMNIEHSGEHFYGIWLVTLIDDEEKKDVSVISSFLRNSEKEVLSNDLSNYKINETYVCYRIPDKQRLDRIWLWKWNKPNKSSNKIELLGGVISFIMGTGYLLWLQPWKILCKTNQQVQH